jgi:hypothetical protein
MAETAQQNTLPNVKIREMFKVSDNKLNYQLFVFIIGLIIISSLLYGFIMINRKSGDINVNWEEYKCKPYIFPFAGTFIGPPGIDPITNFSNCMWDMNKGFFSILIKPIEATVGKLTKTITGVIDDIINIKRTIKALKQNVANMGRDTYQKLYETYARVANIVVVIKQYIMKIINLIKSIFITLAFVFYTLGSVWNGPIGGVLRFFCFSGETQIKIANNKRINIKDIKLGDILDNEQVVNCIIELYKTKKDLYPITGGLVAGSHLIQKYDYDKNKLVFERVENYFKQKINHNDEIYCLGTSNNRISTLENKFTDYFETSNLEVQFLIFKIIKDFINNKFDIKQDNKLDKLLKKYKLDDKEKHILDNFKSVKFNLMGGFLNSTTINLEKTPYTIDYVYSKKIKKIYNTNIIGRVKAIIPQNLILYKYNNIVGTPFNLIKINNEWKALYEIGSSFTLYLNDYIYNIITNTNKFKSGNYEVRDFEYHRDEKLNEFLDTVIKQDLNK